MCVQERNLTNGHQSLGRPPQPPTDPETVKETLMTKMLLTPDEAAEVLGVSRSKLYELLRERQVASVKVGGLRRITMTALNDFVESLTGNDPLYG